MSDWSPATYLRFADERTRPARDLLAAVPLATARHILDVGCGPGNSTELLLARFPDAEVVGVDTSPAMIEAARARVPGARFQVADAATVAPDRPPDLVFANAVMQWVPDHPSVLVRLLGLLAPGGCLAVQMPDTLGEPSHRLMDETAAAMPFASKMAGAGRPPLLTLDGYYDRLSPAAGRVDLWRTTYVHPLDGPDAVVEWVSSTGLKPYLDPLDPGERSAFLADYLARIRRAYPPAADGRVLLRYPRLFIVAERQGSSP
ncbi:trans-aconitate 2-methyltransferase [Chthonobacter rhizosphaerae]|uniref:trans-aconitate 2-methyltransferase n=1 Tax=Chthonobacter rhizosphaerae TaxID=2735553 RepID=UPI0015EE4FE2|nr:trans-aconitate 2-methyltransferase [Chthonobacter rhizosphaerae]